MYTIGFYIHVFVLENKVKKGFYMVISKGFLYIFLKSYIPKYLLFLLRNVAHLFKQTAMHYVLIYPLQNLPNQSL